LAHFAYNINIKVEHSSLNRSTAMTVKIELTATVTVSPTGRSQCPTVSKATVWLSDTVVAFIQKGGSYTPKQILDLFRKQPQLFKPQAGYEMAKSMGYVR
jgi:transposase InsO family protein